MKHDLRFERSHWTTLLHINQQKVKLCEAEIKRIDGIRRGNNNEDK